MKSIVTCKNKADTLTIKIRPNWRSIIGIGYLLIASTFLILLLIGLYFITDDLGIIFRFDQKSFLFIGFMAVSGYFLMIFIKRVFQSEIIEVNDDQLMISKKLLFNTNKMSFQKNEIKDLRFAGTENFTNHTLSAQGFDYLGFQAEERQIQNLIKDGKITFFSKGGIFRFGKDLDADQGEEIIEKIENWR